MSSSNETTELIERGRKLGVPTRCAIPIMGFFGYWLLSANRINMSLTIVAMVNATAVYGNHDGSDDNTILLEKSAKDGEFIWSPKRQGFILGAFYWTLGIGFLIGGRMTEILGSKKVFGFGMLIYSVLTLVTPVSARYHWYVLVAVRALSGLFQGIIFPAFAPLIGKWIPIPERSLVVATVYGGIHFGSFATISISGYLCASEFLGGWPSVYYISGVTGCFWCLLFLFLVYERPSEHPWISDKELRFILDSIKPLATKESPSIPWKSIFLSPSVWALIMGAFAVRWAHFHFYTVHPTYMSTILKYPIAKNGVLSSLPHLLVGVMVLVSGSVSDVIRRRKCMSISANHKCFVTVGMLGYIICLVGVITAGYDITWNTALLIIAMGFTGIAFVGESVAVVDTSPYFSGILMGIRGFLTTSCGFIVPLIVGVLTDEEQTMAKWRTIFYISMAVAASGTIIFDIMGSFEKQPWDPSYDMTNGNNHCSQVSTKSEEASQDTHKF